MCMLMIWQTQAQTPSWSVNPSSYQYNMNFTLVLNMNYTESRDVADKVGAFINTTCVGVQSVNFVQSINRYVAYLTVYSNSVVGDSVSFKMYDASANSTFDFSKKYAFVPNSSIGLTSKPVVLSSPLLSNEATILSFGVNNQVQTSIITSTTVSAMIVSSTAKNLLTTTVTTPALSTIRYANQKDGTYNLYSSTGIDFTNVVYFKIISADESTEKIYSILIDYANASPTDILLTRLNLKEGNEPNSLVAILKTTDTDLADKHTYSLIAGDGSENNADFKIKGDSLISLISFDYEKTKEYTIRVNTNDGKINGEFQKSFKLLIEDFKPAKVEADNVISPSPKDGVNDQWIIRNIHDFPNATLSVYNSTGGLIFTTNAYKNDWEGTQNGQPLPAGTYYYILSSVEGDFKGYISIIRQ